jgi:hypothetical protein
VALWSGFSRASVSEWREGRKVERWASWDRQEAPLRFPEPYDNSAPGQYYLKTRQLSWRIARDSGWYVAWAPEWGRPRLVIPAQDRFHKTVFWQARALDDSPKRYLSPERPRGEALVVAEDDMVRAVVVVEGPMDALAAAAEGYLGIALMGSYPPPEALAHLVYRLRTMHAPVLCLADKDAPGPMSQVLLYLTACGIKAKLVVCQPAKDLAALTPTNRKLLLARSLR